MADNGYLNSSGNCAPIYDVKLVCSAQYSHTAAVFSGSNSLSEVRCWSSNWSSSTLIPVPQKNCEILGPNLTEVQQIEAINGLFPHAVAILAIAWGLRYIRVLVAEWLKERNASD